MNSNKATIFAAKTAILLKDLTGREPTPGELQTITKMAQGIFSPEVSIH